MLPALTCRWIRAYAPSLGRNRARRLALLAFPRRVVVRIGLRNLSTSIAQPVFKAAAHGGGFGGLGGEILQFAEVVFQVVKLDAAVLKEQNQFVIPVADGGRGLAELRAVVRIVPKQIAIQMLAGAAARR